MAALSFSRCVLPMVRTVKARSAEKSTAALFIVPLPLFQICNFKFEISFGDEESTEL
jgi:hypothetical protein